LPSDTCASSPSFRRVKLSSLTTRLRSLYGREGQLDHSQGMTMPLSVYWVSRHRSRMAASPSARGGKAFRHWRLPWRSSSASPTPRCATEAKVLATNVLATVRGNVSASTACVRFSMLPRRWPFRVFERARLSSRATERYGRIVNVISIAAIGWAMLGIPSMP
jgi:hypothetical protein